MSLPEEYIITKKLGLKVLISCKACVKKVKTVLKQIEGVYIVKVDPGEGMKVMVWVKVDSTLDPEILIMKLKSKGKLADLVLVSQQPSDYGSNQMSANGGGDGGWGVEENVGGWDDVPEPDPAPAPHPAPSLTPVAFEASGSGGGVQPSPARTKKGVPARSKKSEPAQDSSLQPSPARRKDTEPVLVAVDEEEVEEDYDDDDDDESSEEEKWRSGEEENGNVGGGDPAVVVEPPPQTGPKTGSRSPSKAASPKVDGGGTSSSRQQATVVLPVAGQGGGPINLGDGRGFKIPIKISGGLMLNQMNQAHAMRVMTGAEGGGISMQNGSFGGGLQPFQQGGRNIGLGLSMGTPQMGPQFPSPHGLPPRPNIGPSMGFHYQQLQQQQHAFQGPAQFPPAMMYARPPEMMVNYRLPPQHFPYHAAAEEKKAANEYIHMFSDENTSSCNIM